MSHHNIIDRIAELAGTDVAGKIVEEYRGWIYIKRTPSLNNSIRDTMPTFYTFNRLVRTGNTFRLAGRTYPAPGFKVGQTIVVSPASHKDVRILGIPESIPNGDGIIVQPIEVAI